MGMGHPAMGIIALVAAAALLVWVSDKPGNSAQGAGKLFAWIGVIISILLLIGQLYVCSRMCMSGWCMYGKGMRGPGMGMMQNMMPGMGGMGGMGHEMPPPAHEKGK